MIDIPSADAPVDAPRGRVLLIEDEPNIATAIGFLLQREGWRVSTHSDGRTALDAGPSCSSARIAYMPTSRLSASMWLASNDRYLS